MVTVQRAARVVVVDTPPSGGGAQNDMVGWIGDSLTTQDPVGQSNNGPGEANILAALTAGGWSASSRVDGLAGRKIRDGSPNPATPTVISSWRADGFDPSTWVFALGNNSWNDGDTKWSSDINANLDDIAAGGGNYRVFLFSMTAPSSPAATYYQSLRTISAANARPNVDVEVIDLDHTLHTGQSESGWWQESGIHMTSTGYAWRNKVMVAMIGGPKYLGPPDGAVEYGTLTGSGVAARINSAGAVNVKMPTGTYTCTDFADAAGYAGFWMRYATGLYGDGNAVFQMDANTSTKASELPPAHSNQGNNFNLFRVDGSPRIAGLTFNGTNQNMPYSGLFLYKCTDPIITDVTTVSLPGDDSVPPGETSGIQGYQATRPKVYWSHLGGAGSAVGFAPNSCTDIVVADTVMDLGGNGASHASANYQCTNAIYSRCTFSNTLHRGANNERLSGYGIYLNCVFENVQLHMEVDNDQGSAFVRIIDPVFEGAKFNVRCGATYAGNPNIQVKANIKLFINGVERADLLNVYT